MPNFGGNAMSEARILERLGQSHEHILEQSRCEQARAEAGVLEVASLPLFTFSPPCKPEPCGFSAWLKTVAGGGVNLWLPQGA